MNTFRDLSLPRPAITLGVAGLVPIIALALQVTTGRPLGTAAIPQARTALIVYGAVVLSFLGGIQWGLAVGSADRSDAWRRYGFSTLPALVALFGLWLGDRHGLVALVVGTCVWGAYEVWSTGLGEAPPWYGRLRIALTIIAAAALAAAANFGPP